MLPYPLLSGPARTLTKPSDMIPCPHCCSHAFRAFSTFGLPGSTARALIVALRVPISQHVPWTTRNPKPFLKPECCASFGLRSWHSNATGVPSRLRGRRVVGVVDLYSQLRRRRRGVSERSRSITTDWEASGCRCSLLSAMDSLPTATVCARVSHLEGCRRSCPSTAEIALCNLTACAVNCELSLWRRCGQHASLCRRSGRRALLPPFTLSCRRI